MRDMIRTFIAISLPEEISQNLNRVISELKELLAGKPLRWTPVKNIHLTLKFLGDVSSKNLDVLIKTIAVEAEQYSAFDINIGNFGVFPSASRPRVLWVGVEASKPLHGIQAGIDQATSRLGYPKEERPFSPHLTLARVSRDASSSETRVISQAVSNYEAGFLGAFQVEEIHLYRSDLQPGGAVYTRLSSVKLQ